MVQVNSSSGYKSPRIGFVDTSLGSITTAPIWYFDQYVDLFRIFRQPNITTAGITFFVINNSGYVGIGTSSPSHLIHLSGGAYSNGSTWNNASSVRWKENIDPLTDGVAALKQLHPVSYNYKKTPDKRTMGFIAEEVGKVLPTIVDWDKAEAGYAESYDHVAILALAVQAVKELATQNSAQQAQIEAMKNENEKLNERIATLERTMKHFTSS
jgi:hypothetical protein